MSQYFNPRTFIVGSKPDAIFPEYDPNLIIAANGAIERVQNYYGKATIIGLVSNYVFSGLSEHANKTHDLIRGCKVNKLVVINALTTSMLSIKPHDSGIIYDNLELHTRWDRTRSCLKNIKINLLLSSIIKDYHFVEILQMLKSLIFKKELKALKVSTGMYGLSLAIKENGMKQHIHLVGIGIDSMSGHFYNENEIYPSAHIEPDKLYLRLLLKSCGSLRITATDHDLTKYIQRFMLDLH